MKIIIADESELLRGVMVKILRFGLHEPEIVEAGTTAEAIAACEAAAPDTVIIDGTGRNLDCTAVTAHLQSKGLQPMVIVTSQFRELPNQYLPVTEGHHILLKEDLTLLPQLITGSTETEDEA